MEKKEGPFGVINLPGYIGGINWPGGSYDPENFTVYTYSQTNPLTIGGIIPNPDHKQGAFDYVHANLPPQNGMRVGDLTVDGLPLIKPPYGRITATDLSSGTQKWQVAHGETPDAIRNHPALKGAQDSAHRHDRQDRAAHHQEPGDLRRSDDLYRRDGAARRAAARL